MTIFYRVEYVLLTFMIHELLQDNVQSVVFNYCEMIRVIIYIKKIDEWFNQCRCTLSPDVNNNSSLLSMLQKRLVFV